MNTLRCLPDEKLLALCACGQNECLNILIERYGNRLMAYIRQNMRQRDDANDIFQETFLRVLLSIREGRYNENGKFIQWIVRIAHNLIVDGYRRRKNAKTVLDADCENSLIERYEEDSTEQCIETEMIHNQELTQVKNLLRQLPSSQRLVIELKHYNGLSFREIAEETDVSINTALGRMRYGIINLRRMMLKSTASLTA